mmetsp:Transcript_5547/g.7011  ORF Transcript_5547/g.7011 Transcript_5547/m.7011 type:complete len:147 (-) Transcript_5547:1219-1659(-)
MGVLNRLKRKFSSSEGQRINKQQKATCHCGLYHDHAVVNESDLHKLQIKLHKLCSLNQSEVTTWPHDIKTLSDEITLAVAEDDEDSLKVAAGSLKRLKKNMKSANKKTKKRLKKKHKNPGKYYKKLSTGGFQRDQLLEAYEAKFVL